MAIERQISTFEVTSNPETMPTMNNHGRAENPSMLITAKANIQVLLGLNKNLDEHEDFHQTPTVKIAKKWNLSVTTTENYDIPEKIAGRFMANQLIGSHPNHSMIEKVVSIMLLPQKTSQPQPRPVLSAKSSLRCFQQLISQNSLSQSSNSASGIGMLAQKDHMTREGTIFHEYNPSKEKYTVWIVDGSLSKVAGTGSIRVTNDLNLNPILHELDSRRMIGNVEMCSRLYLLKGARWFVSSVDDHTRLTWEALKNPKWRKAISEEIKALEKNGTWVISDLPHGKKPIGSYGIDYQETFAPVAKLNTIQVLFYLAANQDWPLHQLDVKNAFLNGNLEEEVYMEIPSELETSFNNNRVCKLKKSLYGLKKSPRAWFDRFAKSVTKQGYTQCDYEEELLGMKKHLAKEFEIKDLGYLRYFLGMEVVRSKKGIFFSQHKYVLDLLKETGMLGCKPADTPMDSTKKIGTEKNSAPVDKGRYQRLIGLLSTFHILDLTLDSL
ncbi:Retrovirus-related Pol polyprotein from transposon RE1 [Vitis vinifera]|uniref:Retrovirus-related Pol polyprotein from transposon RE1 n=1 Tax=Vitis vinifera TaxID=29760 RepID=A0A438IB64_VITVI|nr:Retrovirus-related Pol polyprotein from transposon RE1 [Vitis vinifera]